MTDSAEPKRRGRPPTGVALSSSERSAVRRKRILVEQGGRTITAGLDAEGVGHLERVKLHYGIKTDVDALRLALKLTAEGAEPAGAAQPVE